jgi:HD-GYP domain-containing protein (c-di-GMP phosphodiesterase class II)
MLFAARFLRALGHALDVRTDPRTDVTVRRAADEACAIRLTELLVGDDQPRFRFAASGVSYRSLPLADFEGWPWARRLAERGIATLEPVGTPTDATLAAFLDFAAGLMPGSNLGPRLGTDGLRWGPELPEALPHEGERYPLIEELSVMRQVFGAAELGERLPLGDVHAVVASLGSLLADNDSAALPLLQVHAREAYQPAHAVNTALLALLVGEALGLGPDERRECGLAALLHDIGMARLPSELLSVDRFTSADRARVRGHPLEGARLLLRHGESLDGAAVVSYEHHLRQDGAGYPRLSYPREAHILSRIVAVCDAFDALLAPRHDRTPYDPTSALLELERNAVTQFDPRVVSAFSDVIMRSASAGGLTLTSRVL